MGERYITFIDGEPTTADDPNRSIWYSAVCGYWTDDFDKLKTWANVPARIPVCPDCGCPGFHVDAFCWEKAAKKYEAEGNPRYLEFINGNKEVCSKESIISRYKKFIEGGK